MVSINNDMIEMLTSREQLMEDIDAICDEFFCEYFPSSSDKYEELVRVLCDSVCKNFPTKWYPGQPRVDDPPSDHYRLISSPDPVL